MQKPFQRAALISRHNTPAYLAKLREVIEFLQTEQIDIVLEEQTAAFLENHTLRAATFDNLHQHANIVIVIGGDGSLLSAARKTIEQHLPIIGINLGRLGFLADISSDAIQTKLKAILHGEYIEESRFLLEASTQSGNQCIAVNEMVFASKKMAKMLHFDVHVDNHFMCHFRADGMIISTPTGSTAYSLSGGGPIVHPTLNAILLLPMFSHTLTSRPILLDGDAKISITPTAENESTTYINGDSDACIELQPEEAIHIQKTSDSLKLVHPTDYDYFERLRTKLHWG